MAAAVSERTITTSEQLEEALRGAVSGSGATVNSKTAMQVAAVYACIRIISGAVTNAPLHIKRRVGDRREDASDLALWRLLRKRPNRFQTARQFRRAMQVDVLGEWGNGYAHITKNMKGEPIQLLRLDPSMVDIKQNPDQSKVFEFRRKDGQTITYQQDEIFHLFGLTLDGVQGIGPIRYARETIGDSITLAQHGSTVFKNGARVSGVFETDKTIGQEGVADLKESMRQFRAGGENEGKDMVLEDGLKYKAMALSAQDAQWMEARAFGRTDIGMFYGVPPHMLGVTEKATSWGSGIEEQSLGFAVYSLEDHLTMWEDAIDAHLTAGDDDVYARFNRAAMIRSDTGKRKEFYAGMMQWGVMSPNEVRALEDMNPRAGGDVYYDPPNTAGTPAKENQK